ncbi:hypothetical protein C8A01DRAFT_35015 [Parachaetomium inaequale]|uniref:BTB domain-containing protein n=1 Tax=Parachaetomium inaequale TaxID=2588326 RepID=A0AAN6PH84_9PEZI|nr:hypothetical protein C8A01DRAFT_35015 [Parachaetomium inaequale]
MSPAATTTPDSCPVEVVDRHGDLKLIVRKDNSKLAFQVCSRALARSSPVWDTMLYGPFSEGKDQQNGNDWEIALPEDDADALRIVLFIVHYNFKALPKTVSFDLFFQLTALSDNILPQRLVQRLWISHKLGDERGFYQAMTLLITRAAMDVDGRLFINDSGNKCYLDSDKYLRSLDIVGQVKQARLAMLRKICSGVKDAIDSLTSSSASSSKCIAPTNTKTTPCDCAMLGGLHRAMVSNGVEAWYSSKLDGVEDHLSVSEVRAKLGQIVQDAIVEMAMGNRRAHSTHANCRPWVEDNLFSFDAIVRSLVLGYVEHLKKQAEKSGLNLEPPLA